MAHAGPEALAQLQPVLRQLRELKPLRERTPGSFYLRTMAFVHFHDEAGLLSADIKTASGAGFDRFPIGTAAEQRHFLDEAQRRVARFDED